MARVTPGSGGHGSPNDLGVDASGPEHQDGSGAPRVIVVGTDAGRLAQYQAALGLAQVLCRTTLDTHEAEALIAGDPAGHVLEVLVLDLGVSRLALLQLYGQARSREGGADVQVLFVGQEGDTGPDDHFLPGEPSPVTVSSWVSDLLAGVPETPALDLGLDDVPVTGVGSGAGVAVADEPAHDDERALLLADAASAAPTDAVAPVEPTDAGAPDPTLRVQPVAVAAATGIAAGAAPVPPAPPAPEEARAQASGQRLHVVIVRIGLVLLVLGALLLLVRLEWNPPTMSPPAPNQADTTPTPTGRLQFEGEPLAASPLLPPGLRLIL